MLLYIKTSTSTKHITLLVLLTSIPSKMFHDFIIMVDSYLIQNFAQYPIVDINNTLYTKFII